MKNKDKDKDIEMDNEIDNENESKFRLEGNSFLFTYHDKKNMISKKSIVEEVKKKLEEKQFFITKYYTVQESTKNPDLTYYNYSQEEEGRHFHFYFETRHKIDFEKRFDTKDQLFFDLHFNGLGEKMPRLHGNYLPVYKVLSKKQSNTNIQYYFDNKKFSSEQVEKVMKAILENDRKLREFAVTIMYLLKEEEEGEEIDFLRLV